MVSSARNPNESYAQRAKKASTSSSQTTQQTAPNALSAHPSSLKLPQVNVWAERIKEQKAHTTLQPAQKRATPSPQLPRECAIQPRSPAPDLSAQLAILDQQDEHDPFVVRVPLHLSRQSSSSTNPLPPTDPNAWPHLPPADPPGIASSAGRDSPFLSAPPSRQDSTASVRQHAYSPSRSARLSRVQSSSQHPHSASQSSTQSRSGSSASSPRLQIRGRTLPQDDPIPPDLRLDNQHRGSLNKRSSSALADPPNHISGSFQMDSVPPPVDPPYYRRPPVPPLQDMPSRYAHNFIPPYALPPQFSPAHVSGHTSPSYIPPHSGQNTPPYSRYPPYPAYMYGHHSLFWGDIPPHSHTHLQNQPHISSNHVDASESAAPPKMEFGSVSPPSVADPGASSHPALDPNGWQSRPSKSVMFGTIDLADSQDDSSPSPPNERQPGQPTEPEVDHATEQFATFSIGVSPDEPGPSRLASRRSSVRSLSRSLSSQPTLNDGSKDADTVPPSSHEVNGIKKPIKWEFGTTVNGDLNEPRPASSSLLTSSPPPNHQSKSTENVEDKSDLVDVPSSHGASGVHHSVDKSEAGSPASDVWVVKDYGYGFGDHSGCGNAPDLVRSEMREREKERARDREMNRDQYRDRSWEFARHPGWRHENGVDDGREGWEQQTQIDASRHTRPRRGSLPGYGGHERGGFTGRRGRGFGGRFHGGRGRAGFFHHQRLGSYPYLPPPPPPHPLEVLSPAVDMVNGYGQPPYAPPELASYDAVPLAAQPYVPLPSATYSVDVMRNCLLAQLEYYLSPQNMAQDLFLRQRMDNEGWIPISLLASFRRVRQLQIGADIVKEVLMQSGVVEVNGDWVRMGGEQWRPYALPGAPRSVVTGVDYEETKNPGVSPYGGDAYAEPGEAEDEHGEAEGECDGEDCEGDDEDDDIEFVIGEEAEGSWMPVPERKQ